MRKYLWPVAIFTVIFTVNVNIPVKFNGRPLLSGILYYRSQERRGIKLCGFAVASQAISEGHEAHQLTVGDGPQWHL